MCSSQQLDMESFIPKENRRQGILFRVIVWKLGMFFARTDPLILKSPRKITLSSPDSY